MDKFDIGNIVYDKVSGYQGRIEDVKPHEQGGIGYIVSMEGGYTSFYHENDLRTDKEELIKRAIDGRAF